MGNDRLVLLSNTWVQASLPSLWSMFGYNDCTSIEAIKTFSFGHSGINLSPVILLIKFVVYWMEDQANLLTGSMKLSKNSGFCTETEFFPLSNGLKWW